MHLSLWHRGRRPFFFFFILSVKLGADKAEICVQEGTKIKQKEMKGGKKARTDMLKNNRYF